MLISVPFSNLLLLLLVYSFTLQESFVLYFSLLAFLNSLPSHFPERVEDKIENMVSNVFEIYYPLVDVNVYSHFLIQDSFSDVIL